VVLIEDRLRLPGVPGLSRLVGVGLGVLPGYGYQPVQVALEHAVLGRDGGHRLEPVHLPFGLLEHLFGHTAGLDLFAQLLELAALFGLAQLLADGLHLLAQDLLLLSLPEGAFDLGLDLGFEAQDLLLARHLDNQEPESLGDLGGLQQVLLLGDGEIRGGGDEVGKDPSILGAQNSLGRLLGDAELRP